MNINQIRYVLAVAENQSLSAASAILYVTQPTLSVQIARLEDELGFQIFQRLPTGMVLTQQGLEFCVQAQELVQCWNSLLETSKGFVPDVSGPLRVSLGPRVFSNGLFDVLMDFFDQHPEIELSLVTSGGDDPLTGLKSGLIDVALDRFPPVSLVPELQQYTAIELIPEPYCMLVPPGHPMAGRERCAFTELDGQTFVTGMANSMQYKVHNRDFAISKIHVRPVCSSDSVDVNMRLVRRGEGVSCGPRSFADYYGLKAVPFDPPIQVALKLIYRKANQTNPRIQLLEQFIVEYCWKKTKKE